MDRRHAYGTGIGLVGAVLAVVQVVHGIEQTDRLLVFAFEAGPFALLSLALVFTGGWLARSGEYDRELPRISAWGMGGAVLFAAIAALMLFSQQVQLGTLARASYITTDLVSIGALAGVLVGLYDAQSQQRLRALRQERDRVEGFANKAADVNNYGRALTRSHSLDDVSALVIEAMHTLLGISEAAVLLADDGYETVDDTVGEVGEDTLRRIADRTVDAEAGTLVTHDDGPDGVDGTGSTGTDRTPVSLLLYAGEGQSVVLVALADDPDLPEEDVQLLEMLASHASTALSGILPRGDSAARATDST